MALTGRADLWKTVLEYVSRRPILGYGHDAFWSLEQIEEISSRHSWPINQAHSGYLEMLANLGAVGLSLYIFIIVYGTLQCTRRFLRGDKAYGVASALMVFMLFHSTLESINMLPTFSSFLLFTVLFHAGLLRSSLANE
jgi:exopolysaccharide production protein ExoQ